MPFDLNDNDLNDEQAGLMENAAVHSKMEIPFAFLEVRQ